MADKVGVEDKAEQAGNRQMLVTPLQGQGTGQNDPKLQAFDWLEGGDPFYMRSFGPSVTLPVQSATVPWWHPIVYKVPAGKFLTISKLKVGTSTSLHFGARVSRRYILAGNCATANPGAPTAPTVAVVTHDKGIDNNGTDTYDYKITQVNALGQETVASAASATLTPTTAQRAIDVTIPALATGAVNVGVYRRKNAGTWNFVVESQGGVTFRDTRLEADLDSGRTAPGAATWGNAFAGVESVGPCELIYACINAISAAPARLVYKDDSGKQDNVAFAPATAAGTFVRIPLAQQEVAAYWASPATPAAYQSQDARTTDYGAVAVLGFNNTFANMAGQWVIWGMQPLLEASPTMPVIVGSRIYNPLLKPMPIPSGATICVEIGFSLLITAAASIKDIELFGRLYDNPT